MYACYKVHKKPASDPYQEPDWPTLNIVHCFKTTSDTVMLADSGVVYGVDLRRFHSWDWGFASRSGHGLSSPADLCVAYLAASTTSRLIVQRSPTICVCVCLIVCDLETSQRGGLDPIWVTAPQKPISIYVKFTKVATSIQVFRLILHMHLSSLPYVLHVQTFLKTLLLIITTKQNIISILTCFPDLIVRVQLNS